MKLTRDQSQKLLQERGVWITEACGKCGQLLGAVRWTRRGEPGAWCSAECRDGIGAPKLKMAAAVSQEQARRKLIGARPVGRPKKHANNAEKCRSYRESLRNVLATRNTPSEQIENARLADAKNGSHVVGLIPRPQGLETPSARECAR